MSNDEKFQSLMARVFEDHRGDLRDSLSPAEYERSKRDFAFHMADWATDLEGLARLYSDPDRMELDQAVPFVIGFLYHVVPHLNAAGRLLLDEIRDPFAPPSDGSQTRVERMAEAGPRAG